MQKGIFWLSFPNQQKPSVPAKFDNLAKHFHVTLQFGVDLTPEIQKLLGEAVEVQVVANCFNDRIQALRIELPGNVKAMCNNAVPHMTISMVDGVKPVESNDMLSGEHEELLIDSKLTLRFDFFQFG